MDTKLQEAPSSIANFSLGELIHRKRPDHTPTPDFVIAHSNVAQLEELRFPCRIDAFILGLGTEGRTELSINLNEYTLRKNTLFLIGLQSIIQTKPGGMLRGDTIVVSTQFMQRLDIDSKQLMPLMLQLGAHPTLEISDDESRELRNFIALMENETKGKAAQFSEQIIGQLFMATLYKIGNTLQHYLARHPEAEQQVRNRADTYFRRFLRLLSIHYKEERSVGFYARELCITPKYLTTLVKRISSRSVSEWIEIYVILEAKTLLKYSGMSVQEIAYTLNFPNQSFFGSYFKRNTGMSPSQYKASGSPNEGGGYSLAGTDNVKGER